MVPPLLHLGNVNFNNDSTPEDEAARVADPGGGGAGHEGR